MDYGEVLQKMTEKLSGKIEESNSKILTTCCETNLFDLRYLEEICEECEYRILADIEDRELSLASDLYYEDKFGRDW